MRIFLAFLMSLVASNACAAVPSLCGANEKVIFSCQTRKGIASVCDYQGKSGETLQYRFGKMGRIALSYPAYDTIPDKSFVADTLMFSGGGGSYLQFAKDGFSYTVFTAIGKWGKNAEPAEAEGVAVSQGDKEVANLPCTGAYESSLGPDLFHKLGLKKDTSKDGFQIPEAFFPQ